MSDQLQQPPVSEDVAESSATRETPTVCVADRVGETCPEGDYCLWPREAAAPVTSLLTSLPEDGGTVDSSDADAEEGVMDLPAEAVMADEPAAAPDADSGSADSPAVMDDAAPPASPPPPPEDGGTGKADDGGEEERPMTLLDHLTELRNRLIRVFISVGVGFLLCYTVAQKLFHLLALPLIHVLPGDSRLMFTGLPGGFFVELKVAFVAGIFLASPYIFYQIWAFIAPGLYASERRHIIPLAACSALFFLGGASFCYFVVFPFAFAFFVSYASDVIVAMPSINEYLSFSLEMLMAFGLIFEMPLFAFFLARMGLITATRMRAVRRYAILGVFIVAAILTPPDVFSQMLMAVPMLLLYELSILVAVMVGKEAAREASRETEETKA